MSLFYITHTMRKIFLTNIHTLYSCPGRFFRMITTNHSNIEKCFDCSHSVAGGAASTAAAGQPQAGYGPPPSHPHLPPAYLSAAFNHADYLNAAAAFAAANDEASRMARKRALSPQEAELANHLLRHSPIDSTATASLQLGAALAVAAAAGGGGSPSSSGSFEQMAARVSPVFSSAHHLQQLQAHLLRSSPYMSPQNSLIHSAAAAAAAAALHSSAAAVGSHPSYHAMASKSDDDKATNPKVIIHFTPTYSYRSY